MIAEFQKKYGLISDGVIGKKTLLKIKDILNIQTNEELANFMGQCDHESGAFSVLFEIFFYFVNRL